MSTYNKTSKPRFRIESKCERFGVSNFTRDMLQLSRVKVQLRNADAHGLRDMYSDVFGPADTKLDLGIGIELERTFRLRWRFRGLFPGSHWGCWRAKWLNPPPQWKAFPYLSIKRIVALSASSLSMMFLNIFRLLLRGYLGREMESLFFHFSFGPCTHNITHLYRRQTWHLAWIPCMLFIYDIVLSKKGWGAPFRVEGQTGVI